MKLSKLSARVAKSLLIVSTLSLPAMPGHSAVLLKDGYEVGGLTAITNNLLSGLTGIGKWVDDAEVSVVSSLAKTGNYSARFHFAGNSSTAEDADAWAELRFDLGQPVKELWIQYDMYIPSNYAHRQPSGPANNKFIRLWGQDYGDFEKVGISAWPNNGFSKAIGDWNMGGGIGPNGQEAMNLITSADRGKWVTYKMYFKAATSSAAGTMKLWKNGALIMDNTNKVTNYSSSNIHAYRYGYILGWSNSGFSQTTDIYVDNVVMATTEAELGGTSAPAPTSPPNPPELRVTQ